MKKQFEFLKHGFIIFSFFFFFNFFGVFFFHFTSDNFKNLKIYLNLSEVSSDKDFYVN